ncbi:SHOCT domain-containing protein [Halorubrum sp. Boch-26]|uniref:SHOCT domain-containing protein n=1 Tax=Halorubrum sp. Boch-26 TaxID=2994426 RepID=UPI002468E628|nr:SHOCT domain-containing protein [Halorubrum sp. Boch-26]
MALPTFEKNRLIGLVAILSFGLTSLFAVLLPEVLGALLPATFILGFFVLIPLVLLLGEDFPLAESEGSDGSSATTTDEDPLTTLRERYATGEIGEEEFERRLDRLLETEELDDRVAAAGDRRGPRGRRERETELE